MPEYHWRAHHRDLHLWVHRHPDDPSGAAESDLDPQAFAQDLARRLLLTGDWRVAVWDRPWPGHPALAVVTRRTCVGCGEHTLLARDLDNVTRLIDPEPAEGGDMLLSGDLNASPTAVPDVPEGGTLPWGGVVPPDTPRYREHRCR